MQKTYYPSLNGLRAISIIMVVLYHLQKRNGIFDAYSKKIWLAPFISFIRDGQLGVNIFFVISGFLITSLLINEEKETGKISIKSFYIRRIIRIFPAYYFLLAIYLVLQFFNLIEISRTSWLTAITYTKYFIIPKDWLTAHIWSLSVEEHFYLFWPTTFILGSKQRKQFAIALFLVVPLIRTYIHFYPVTWINDLTIFLRIDAIATGCLFALYQKQIVKLFQRHWTVIFYFAVIGLFFLRYFPKIGRLLHLEFIFIPLESATIGTLGNIFVSVILIYSVFGPQKLWFKLLNHGILNHIGILSYSIYLWQQLFINNTPYWFNSIPYNLGYLIIVSHASYYFIEKPFLKLKTRYSKLESQTTITTNTI
ncbi:acyltransferase [Pelobium sp.]|nr:acyltransferase [Pelobium sp.]MDA9554704.1 acyltransferase [Pelobium sp.]